MQTLDYNGIYFHLLNIYAVLAIELGFQDIGNLFFQSILLIDFLRVKS